MVRLFLFLLLLFSSAYADTVINESGVPTQSFRVESDNYDGAIVVSASIDEVYFLRSGQDQASVSINSSGINLNNTTSIIGTASDPGDSGAVLELRVSGGDELEMGVSSVSANAWIRSAKPGVQFNSISIQPDGGATFVGNISSSVNIYGVIDGSSAAVGIVGEVVHGELLSASRKTLTTVVWEDLVSINITAGTWLISSQVQYEGSSIIGTGFGAAVGQSSGSSGSDIIGGNNKSDVTSTPNVDTDLSVVVRPHVLNLASSAVLYLKAISTFTSGTLKAYGTIDAIRFR